MFSKDFFPMWMLLILLFIKTCLFSTQFDHSDLLQKSTFLLCLQSRREKKKKKKNKLHLSPRRNNQSTSYPTNNTIINHLEHMRME